jgi:hypothetical protein
MVSPCNEYGHLTTADNPARFEFIIMEKVAGDVTIRVYLGESQPKIGKRYLRYLQT